MIVPQPVTTPSPGILLFLHAEFVAAVFDEHVELLEGAFVEQEVDALARGQLALGVLGRDALLAPARARRGALGFKGGDDVFHGWLPLVEPGLGNRRPAPHCGQRRLGKDHSTLMCPAPR